QQKPKHTLQYLLFTRKMATLVRLPVELTNMVAAYLTSPKDFLSWISVDPEVLQELLENKSAVFESFMNRDLLPPALGVLRLREIHQQSTELPSTQDLITSAFKSKVTAKESTPGLVWPTDKASALALLELMDEVECIATAMHNYRYRDDSFWPETPWLQEHPEHSKRPEGLDFMLYDERTTRLLQHDSFWDKKDEHRMFVQNKLVLLYEIYVLCFCYGREFPDHTSNQTPFEILSMATEDTSTQIDIHAIDFGQQHPQFHLDVFGRNGKKPGLSFVSLYPVVSLQNFASVPCSSSLSFTSFLQFTWSKKNTSWRKMSTTWFFPTELHLMIISYLEDPKDLYSWISAKPQVIRHIINYKSTVFGKYIDCHLLPELLAVVRLRQMHQRRPTRPSTNQLVKSACDWLTGIGPRNPELLWPEDFDSILTLLKIIEEVNTVLSGLWVHEYENTERYFFFPWQYLPSSRRSRGDWFTDFHEEEDLFYKQRAVLCFEIYVQSLYIGRAPDESASELALCRDLDTALNTWEIEDGLYPVWLCFNNIAKFFYRRYDEYLWLCLREVIDVEKLEKKISAKSKIVLRDQAQSLKDAIQTQDVVYHSAKLSWTRLSVKQMPKDLEAIPSQDLASFERLSKISLESALVCYRKSGGTIVPIYRFACNKGPEFSREFLFQRDERGLTMVAPLRTAREKEGWDSVDEIFNAWRWISGGIGPMAQLLRMTDAEKRRVLSESFVRANAISRSGIERMQRTRLQSRSFLRSWMIKFYSGYRPFQRGF
ncbi:hypothetical protein GQ607_010012, partial [Colletotrichum asianum]